METENYYDTISDNITTSPAENDGQKQRIYIQVSIPDINMKVIRPISFVCIVHSFTAPATAQCFSFACFRVRINLINYPAVQLTQPGHPFVEVQWIIGDRHLDSAREDIGEFCAAVVCDIGLVISTTEQAEQLVCYVVV